MVYQDYDKEDIKNESFQIIAELEAEAIRSYLAKNPAKLIDIIDSIFCIIYPRLKEQKRDHVEKRITIVKDMIYKQQYDDDNTPQLKSQALDEARDIWKLLNETLDKEGLLFGITVNPGELITKR